MKSNIKEEYIIMKKTRILAGLLSLAMTASLLPMQAMAASALDFSYNFEDSTDVPAGFGLSTAGLYGGDYKRTAEDWTVSVADDGTGTGNHALKYKFDSAGGTKPLSSNINSDPFQLSKPLASKITPADNWYEYGFSYKMDTALATVSQRFMSLCPNTSTPNANIYFEYANNMLTAPGRKSVSMINGKWVDVKVYLRNDAGKNTKNTIAQVYRSYTDDEGEVVTEKISEQNGVDLWGNLFNIRMFLTGNTNMNDGDSFMIDNVYFKESDSYKTVTFNLNNGENSIQVSTPSGEINSGWFPAVSKTDSIFDGWYKDAELTQPFDGTGITENMNVYAKWLDAYTLSFDTQAEGISADDVLVLQSTGRADKLPAPARAGYKLDGWYTEPECTNLYDGTSVTENKTLYAKWSESDYLYYVGVDGRAYPDVYDSGLSDLWDSEAATDADGNSYIKYTRNGTAFNNDMRTIFDIDQKIKFSNYDEKSTSGIQPTTDAYEIGYRFKPIEAKTESFMNITATGNHWDKRDWSSISQWKTNIAGNDITYTLSLGNTNNKIEIKKSSIKPGTYISSQFFINPTVEVAADNMGKDAYTAAIGVVKYIDAETGEEVISEKEYQFKYYTGSTKRYMSHIMPISASLLWNQDAPRGTELCIDDFYVTTVKTKTVTFVTNDETITQEPISTISDYITLPVIKKDGWAIDWFKDEECTIPFKGTGITGDMTVYAKWTKLHKITFVTNSTESTIDPIETTGDVDISDKIPTNGLLGFDGWYEDADLTIPFTKTTIDADITLYAKWINMIYRENFEDDDYHSGWLRSAQAKDYYTAEVVTEENGNRAMKYQYNKTDTAYTPASKVMNYTIEDVEVKKDGTSYEIGYSFKPTKGVGFVPEVFILKNHGGSFSLFAWDGNDRGPVALGKNRFTDDDKEFLAADINGYVTVRAIVEFTDEGKTLNGKVFVNAQKTDGNLIHREYAETVDISADSQWKNLRFIFNLGKYHEPADKTSVLLDDIYIRQAEAHEVTFNFMDGRESITKTSDKLGNVELPEEPTRENYGFIGWYTDEGCTIPFINTDVRDDMTVYALWQTNPTVTADPKNGATGVDLTPEIKLYFDSLMDTNTINKSTVTVYSGALNLSEEDYNVSTDKINGKTIARITFNRRLNIRSEYTVKVSKDVKNLVYNMTEDFVTKFTTRGLALSVFEVTVKNYDGSAFTNLKDNANQKINVTFKLRNNVEDSVNYVSVFGLYSGNALKSCTAEAQKTIDANAESEQSVEIEVPSNAEESDTISMITLDGLNTLNPLAEKIEVR